MPTTAWALPLWSLLAWSAAAQLEVKVPAEANGKVAELGPCGGLSHIVVETATFGASCFGGRQDGCTAMCTANCAGCTPVYCPAVNGAALGKCAEPDVTSVVGSACDGRGVCSFPICIASEGQPVAGQDKCLNPPALFPLGDPAYGCTKEFVVQYRCSVGGWGLVAVLLLGTAGYAAGGVLYAQRVQGRKAAAAGLWPTVQTHPHYAKWLEFAALVADGVTHTRARLGTGKVRASVGGAREQVSSQRITQEQSQHRERKEKKKKQTQDESVTDPHSSSKKTQRNASRAQPLLADLPVAAGEGARAPTSAASGGGGRWVHVPT